MADPCLENILGGLWRCYRPAVWVVGATYPAVGVCDKHLAGVLHRRQKWTEGRPQRIWTWDQYASGSWRESGLPGGAA